MKNLKIGDILYEKGLITKEQLQKALQIQKESNFTKKLGEILIEEGFVDEKDLTILLAEQLGFEFVDLFSINIDFSLIRNYSLNLFKNAEAVPFKEDEDFIYVGIVDPLNYESLELIERTLVKPIRYFLVLKSDIKHIFERIEIIETTQALISKVKSEINSQDYKIDKEQSAIMSLIEQILKSSIINGASDIHIEPNEHDISVRNRIDGVLREIFVFDKEIYNALVSRIKVLGNMDISEKRKAQDGRFSLKIGNSFYDFRLSTSPTFWGESIVMRVLDQKKILLKLNELGLSEKNLKKFHNLIHSPYGIVFITGPTGSGKTTTLYATLNEIKSIENKIITIEDPIEYQLPLIQQMQINEKIGYGFNEILRSVLRQDPDIIMVGEIRDTETLMTATSASLTGHLVFATLHTNDAPSAITRMLQMGIPSYLVSDSLVGVVTQRLVRKICKFCKKEHKPKQTLIKEVESFLPDEYKFYSGEGCAKCSFTGYSGRIMISEILIIDKYLANLITDNIGKYSFEEEAIKHGYEPMIIDGLDKALRGITSLEEILRVVKV